MRKDIIGVLISRLNDNEPDGIVKYVDDVYVGFSTRPGVCDNGCYVSELDHKAEKFGLTRAEVWSIEKKAMEIIRKGATHRYIDLVNFTERDFYN